MRINKACLLSLSSAFLFTASLTSAQVVAPIEIRDQETRILQQAAINDLNTVGKSILAHRFHFAFYLSRKLDIDEKQQLRTDQHSIRFERYNGAMVLAISGNYYSAYSSDRFTAGQRAKETFLQVVLPIVKAAAPVFQNHPSFQGYAIEVSHHVISKTMGMPIERPENLMVYIPQSAAVKLAVAENALAQQVAVMDAQVYLNANRINLWLTEGDQPEPAPSAPLMLQKVSATLVPSPAKTSISLESDAGSTIAKPDPKPVSESANASSIVATTPAANVLLLPALKEDLSPKALGDLQISAQGATNHLIKDLDTTAHFVTYAPPAIIPFRHHAYLELSLTTTLSEASRASRYKTAALAFEEHISPLIRRVLSYFPGDQGFYGISFSTTVHGHAKPGVPALAPLSVEFFFSVSAMRCYEAYDCTSQQLIDSGTVLISGERVGLDLQKAEASE